MPRVKKSYFYKTTIFALVLGALYFQHLYLLHGSTYNTIQSLVFNTQYIKNDKVGVQDPDLHHLEAEKLNQDSKIQNKEEEKIPDPEDSYLLISEIKTEPDVSKRELLGPENPDPKIQKPKVPESGILKPSPLEENDKTLAAQSLEPKLYELNGKESNSHDTVETQTQKSATNEQFQKLEKTRTDLDTKPQFKPSFIQYPFQRQSEKKRKRSKKKTVEPVNHVVVQFTEEFSMQSYVNCSKLFQGEVNDTELSNAIHWEPSDMLSDDDWGILSERCENLRSKVYFPSEPRSETEKDFPLAYVLMVYQDMEQIVRLLQAIYWPQNVYCIHYDVGVSNDTKPKVKAKLQKKLDRFQTALRMFVRCFPNIFIASQLVDIEYPTVSILNAAMSCYRDLARHDVPWRYVQTWAGTGFPLRTNAEMVQIFKIFNGSLDVKLTIPGLQRYIIDQRSQYTVESTRFGKKRQTKRYTVNPIIPGNMTLYKNLISTALTREFVEWMVWNPSALELLEWSQSQLIAGDEQYVGTLVHNPHLGAPGAFPGVCIHWYLSKGIMKETISRRVIWNTSKSEQCHGKVVHESCVFGVNDLQWLHPKLDLSLHKIWTKYQPAVGRCLAERLFRKVYLPPDQQFQPQIPLDLEYYQNLPAVRYQNLQNKDEFMC